ncbi:MAG: hypothetical protein JNM24_15460 [Bdellovibrionaceae bacterium]|jgi:hypothetical protein|nr:hypothetical protein [Pseudobdellovibrionaceae bacterium]
MNLPVENLYAKFGDPYRVVEFRAFSFNTCRAGCKNCFYQKTNNEFYDFQKCYDLAVDFKKNHYTLETFYILPTDIFENDFNYRVFYDEKFKSVAKLFNYIGVASTLRHGFDEKIFDYFFHEFPGLKIELHVNLLEEEIGKPDYVQFLSQTLTQIKTQYGDQILINLALNIGSQWQTGQLNQVKHLVSEYSQDKILELNFTFMFNDKISYAEKARLIESSYPVLEYFGREFQKTERRFNSRTLLRKPSITFKNDRIYLSPIIPFDEYIFMDEPDFQLSETNFDSFLTTYQKIEAKNIPQRQECQSCEHFEYCYGKGFFSIMNHYNLPCLKVCGGKNGN